MVIILTGDGSHSIKVPEMKVSYHSKYGAIQESMHVYIDSGFTYMQKQSNRSAQVSILEIGFGTGLNCLLTAIEAENVINHFILLQHNLNYGQNK